MTIKVGHNAQGHHSHNLRQPRFPIPTGPDREPVVHVGIERQPDRRRTAQDLPVSARHETILQAMGTIRPVSPREIALAVGLPRGGVNSSLYALQDRGLCTRIPYKGWIRTGA
jgi:hypothetical protein